MSVSPETRDARPRVDEPPGGMQGGGGVEEPSLFHPNRRDSFEPVGVIDMRIGTFGHRLVGCVPSHPELGCGLGDRVAVLVDHLGDPSPGPHGQHRPRGDPLQPRSKC